MNCRSDITDFKDVPNVGPATVKYLHVIGISCPYELIGQDPYSIYDELCQSYGKRFDPCLADVLISAVRFMEGAPSKKWWKYSEERKKHMTGRQDD